MSDKKQRGPLGCLLVLVGIVALVGGLGLVANLGLTWYHYSNTPDFATYLTTHPVDVGVLDERVGIGEVLEEGRTWMLGDVDPWDVSHEDPDLEHVSLTVDVDIEHGDESLLSLRQRYLMVLSRETGERLGFRLETPQLERNRNMRVLVVVHLDLESILGEDSPGLGSGIVDVFLAAGAGKSKVVILRRPEDMKTREDVLAGLGLPSRSTEVGKEMFLSLLTHSFGSPPVIGLIHHVRQPVSFGWHKEAGTIEGVGLFDPDHSVTTQEYSYTFTVSSESKQGGGGHSISSSHSMDYTWKDEVW